jgi:phenylalanyl-tRNA synthetase alpha chain
MKNVPVEFKKDAGQLLNAFKVLAEEKFAAHAHLQQSKATAQQTIDTTLPAAQLPIGTRHPLKIVENQIVSIFEKIGFAVATGPEVEDDWHNFTSLNMPENHTARDMQDTFYVSQQPDWVLRTHTSSVQARILEKEALPIRVICPGRVYRNETISARAHCFFHQCEGLYVNKNVSFADLKQALYFFVTEMFGADTKVRFRPSYFPFTEPSAEMDISCTVCGGTGCNLCKHTGWVEILGCGMVHPNMLKNFNIDPEVYSGYAFGMGVERITQIKFQINDLRLYSQNDVRFLRQFERL